MLISLTTDFGTRDGYVGAMKGVILKRNPHARLIDITHDIPPQDVVAGAMTLACSHRHFPDGTIHVVVVDPGVGTKRKPIIAKSARFLWVLPDNGLLTLVDRQDPVEAAYEISAPLFRRHEVSSTFHGRDIFAPAAAQLSLGCLAEAAGPRLDDWVRLDIEEPKIKDGVVHGDVMHVDVFGNLITNIPAGMIGAVAGSRVVLGKHGIGAVQKTYGAVAEGTALALMGSGGFLEISINGGNAAEVFGEGRGSHVMVWTED